MRTALRLGTHQLLSMRVPSHAAVGTTVELVRAAVGERPVRLVNAVLRRVTERTLDEWLAQLAPDPSADPIGHLSLRFSHPRWIVEEFSRLLPKNAEVEALLAADNVAPTVTLAVRPGLARVDGLAADGVQPGRWSPYAGVLAAGDPAALEAVRAGRVGVQDEGSQLVALAFAGAGVEGDDSRWLDLCAGPGGKAALLTGLARERGATLIANRAAAAPRAARQVGSARLRAARHGGLCRRNSPAMAARHIRSGHRRCAVHRARRTAAATGVTVASHPGGSRDAGSVAAGAAHARVELDPTGRSGRLRHLLAALRRDARGGGRRRDEEGRRTRGGCSAAAFARSRPGIRAAPAVVAARARH